VSAPLGGEIEGDDARAHGLAEQRGGQPDRTLAEDRERVAAGHVEALERAVGGARPARDGRALLEGELVGQRNERPRGHLHERRVPAVPGHAVDDEAVRAELRPALPAVRAAPAARVVVVHDALADRDVGDAGADDRHDSARLVAGDDRAAAGEAERRGRVTAGPVGVQVAPAHARRLDRDHDLARAGEGIGELP